MQAGDFISEAVAGRLRREFPDREELRVSPETIYQALYVPSRPVPSRPVPGHREGDFIIGKGNQSAIDTLVERSTNYTMMVHLPDGYTAEETRDALTAKIKTLPKAMRTTLTWDQGVEVRE